MEKKKYNRDINFSMKEGSEGKNMIRNFTKQKKKYRKRTTKMREREREREHDKEQ